ncbi:MAG: PepSY domain-containing protein [Elainellaceae cyanobacterium]
MKIFLILLSISVLGIGGLSAFVLIDGDNVQSSASAQPPHDESGNLNKTADLKNEMIAETYELEQIATVTLLQAIQIAETFAEGQAVEAELEWKNDVFVYSVEIEDQEIVIDANTGDIIFTATENEEAGNLQQLATITLQQAVEMAESAANERAYSAELEEENGRLVYAVEVGNQEFHIDPDDGTILNIEIEGHESNGLQLGDRGQVT